MILKNLQQYLAARRDTADQFFAMLHGTGKDLLLRTEVWDCYKKFCDEKEDETLLDSPLAETMYACQDAALSSGKIYLATRPQIARWQYLEIDTESVSAKECDVSEYLAFKERLILGEEKHDNGWTLEIDLEPFNRGFPQLRETRSIGKGVEFLNRKLSSQLFFDSGKGAPLLFEFLRLHHCHGKQLMIGKKIKSVEELRIALRQADDYLISATDDTPWKSMEKRLDEMGFKPGWGDTARRVRENIRILSDILEAPDPSALEKFLGRIPMIFSIAILSPHGYFGQSDVLGLPDTGGQVVYILDQVRALEKEMKKRIAEQGLDIEPKIVVLTRLIPEAGHTTCDQPEEKIEGTDNAQIVRIPFYDKDGNVLQNWISRFEVWPYLERFSIDTETELLSRLGSRPDLIIGNYSDGNLVASMLSRRLKVTQCNIAHALEKAKYLYSDLFWKKNDNHYHFSCQFTADLIAMNSADFIITSTYQEIAGRPDSVGQYESYGAFTMPGLYRVVNGLSMFDPKFNIVSPGADSEIYFNYADKEKRSDVHDEAIGSILFGEAVTGESRGSFDDKQKPIIFTMARLDRIKNITGLTRWYAESERLRNVANLLIIAGTVDAEKSSDEEEKAEIATMHRLFDEMGLDSSVRWIGSRLEKKLTGELYRRIADNGGVFVQPALFEAFGLTVIESMTSGLPTFATCFGGPLEIIEHGKSGFHINPNKGEENANMIARFLEKSNNNKKVWMDVSKGSIERIESRYTWELYAKRMMTLSRIYGFWKYATNLDRDETRRYLEMLYGLQFRGLAQKLEK